MTFYIITFSIFILLKSSLLRYLCLIFTITLHNLVEYSVQRKELFLLREKIVIVLITLMCSLILITGIASVSNASKDGGANVENNNMNMTDMEMKNMGSDQMNVPEKNNMSQNAGQSNGTSGHG